MVSPLATSSVSGYDQPRSGEFINPRTDRTRGIRFSPLGGSAWLHTMTASARRTLGGWLPGALTVLLAGPFLAPSEVRAGCDYPVRVWHTRDVSHSAAKADPPSTHPHSPAPCHGPTCSRRPAQAPGTVLLVRIASAEPGALVDPRLLWAAINPGTLIDLADSPAPVRRTGDIFRPPRSSSLFIAL